MEGIKIQMKFTEKSKRILSSLLLVFCLQGGMMASAEEITAETAQPAGADIAPVESVQPQGIPVLVDGTAVVSDVPAQIIQDRVMLPFRAILEKLGAKVEWNAEYQIVTATRGSTVLNLRIDKNAMVVLDLKAQTDTRIELDVAPQIIDGRTMVPVRAVAEALDAVVDWNAETRTVSIQAGVVSAQGGEE